MSETIARVRQELTRLGLDVDTHTYSLRPYFNEIGGAWLLLSGGLLLASVWLAWGWPSGAIVVIGAGVVILESRGVHVVSSLIHRRGENLLLQFEPETPPDRELILSAHLDSKTLLLPEPLARHANRLLLVGMLIGLVTGGLASGLAAAGIVAADVRVLNATLRAGAVLHLLCLLPTAVNFLFGRCAPPSRGAVDNGAACAILLRLAHRLHRGELTLRRTRVTIALFTGEEVVIQGSRAYVADRAFPLPAAALNLELMGQAGPYAVWHAFGSPFQRRPADPALLARLNDALAARGAPPPVVLPGPAGTDSLAFALAGIPAVTLATLDPTHGADGLHTAADTPSRVHADRLDDGADLAASFLRRFEREDLSAA